MVTDVLSRVPVERISEQAREVRPGRAALTVVAAVLFAAGWVAFKMFSVMWLARVWSAVAVREGWREARNAQVKRGLAGTG